MSASIERVMSIPGTEPPQFKLIVKHEHMNPNSSVPGNTMQLVPLVGTESQLRDAVRDQGLPDTGLDEMFVKAKEVPEIGILPDPLHTSPVDLTKHWTVLDQTKSEFRDSGRSGVILLNGPEDSYRAKVTAFLSKFGMKWNFGKDYLVIEHDTEARKLFDAMRAAGLNVELIEKQ
jgi:hypothetical protein